MGTFSLPISAENACFDCMEEVSNSNWKVEEIITDHLGVQYISHAFQTNINNYNEATNVFMIFKEFKARNGSIYLIIITNTDQVFTLKTIGQTKPINDTKVFLTDVENIVLEENSSTKQHLTHLQQKLAQDYLNNLCICKRQNMESQTLSLILYVLCVLGICLLFIIAQIIYCIYSCCVSRKMLENDNISCCIVSQVDVNRILFEKFKEKNYYSYVYDHRIEL